MKFFLFIVFLFYFNNVTAMDKPYHHIYKNGVLFAFQNIKGGPQRDPNFKWNWKVFREEKKKLKIDYPPEHVIDKQIVLENLEKYKSDSYVMWLGHASFLIRIAELDLTILTDPVFEKNYGPLWFGPKRFVDSPLTLKELPKVDVIALTHNHYDHMSIRTIKNFPNKKVKVLVPLKLGRYFTRNGYLKENVNEMDWYNKINVSGLSVTALPSQHWSKRWIWGVGNTNRSLWTSFLFEYKDKKIFFACDTGPHPKLYKELGEKYGPVDVAFGNLGAYNFFPIVPKKDSSTAHTNPEELLSLMKDLKVKKVIGMHWGTAILSLEPIMEPKVRFKANAEKFGYKKEDAIIFKIGEIKKLEDLIN